MLKIRDTCLIHFRYDKNTFSESGFYKYHHKKGATFIIASSVDKLVN